MKISDPIPSRRRRTLALGAMGWCAAQVPGAAALAQTQTQDYPSRPIRLIMPWPAGGSSDMLARLVTQRMAAILGQPIVVENRPGAGSNIGTEHAVRSPADGYTMLWVTAPTIINISLYKLSYDPFKDLAPVARFATAPQVLIVHPSVPVRNVGELLALAKAKPGSISFGSAANGSAGHLALEMLKARAGVDMVHVPYKGAGPALAALVGGQIHALLDTATTSLPFIRTGKVKPLAVTGFARSAILPDLPLLSDTVPGINYSTWFGIAAPAGTPPAIVNKLNAVAVQALENAELRQRFADIATEVAPLGSADFLDVWQKEAALWSEAVRTSGAKVD